MAFPKHMTHYYDTIDVLTPLTYFTMIIAILTVSILYRCTLSLYMYMYTYTYMYTE
jgi:hypothetical protein